MKNNVHLSNQAMADLDDISNYITGQLKNPMAANHTVNGIIHAMEQLEIFSGAGVNRIFFQRFRQRLQICDV